MWTAVGSVRVPVADAHATVKRLGSALIAFILASLVMRALGYSILNCLYMQGTITSMGLFDVPIMIPYLRYTGVWPATVIALELVAHLTDTAVIWYLLAIPLRYALAWYAYTYHRHDGSGVLVRPADAGERAFILRYGKWILAIFLAAAFIWRLGPPPTEEGKAATPADESYLIAVGLISVLAGAVYKAGKKTPIVVPAPGHAEHINEGEEAEAEKVPGEIEQDDVSEGEYSDGDDSGEEEDDDERETHAVILNPGGETRRKRTRM